MGIIKKDSNYDNTKDSKKEQNLQNENIKILGRNPIIKQDLLSKELIYFPNEQFKAKKIIKRDEVPLPVNEIVEDIKDINLVSQSSLEYELEEEKKKYLSLNEDLKVKIVEYEEKLRQLEKSKEDIIKQAQNEAQLIIQKAINEAQTKVKEIFENSYQEGFNKGLSEAIERVKQEYNQKISELQEEINKFLKMRENLAKEFEKDLIELVFAVAEKIINKKINEDPTIVTSSLYELLSKVEKSKSITIWVNPDEIDYVRNYKDKLQYILEDIDNVNIIPDEKVEKGGCIIETNFGKLDSRISTKLEVLKEILLKNA